MDYLTTHHPTAKDKWANLQWRPGSGLLDEDDDEGPSLVHLAHAVGLHTPVPGPEVDTPTATAAPEIPAYDTMEQAVQAALNIGDGDGPGPGPGGPGISDGGAGATGIGGDAGAGPW